MQRKMREIEVKTTTDGEIEILQEYMGMDTSAVYITVDQVDTLIKWLQEAKRDLEFDPDLEEAELRANQGNVSR